MFANTKKLFAVTALGLVVTANGSVRAASGDVDPAFGLAGKLAYNGEPLPMPDGRIAIANSVESAFEVRMLDENGQPDPTYGDNGVARVPLAYGSDYESVNSGSGTVGADGSLAFRAEVVKPATGRTLPAVVKLDPIGHPDPTFGANGNGIVFIENIPPEVNSLSGIALQADGALLVTGGFQGYDYCDKTGGVLRLLPNGTADTGFGTNGWALISDSDICGFEVLGLRADASLIVTTNDGRFWALKSNGALETSFGTGGRQLDDLPALTDSLLLHDGGIMLVGLSEGAARFVRLDAAGRRDASFGTGGAREIRLGELAFGSNAGVEEFPQLKLSADGQSVLVQDHIHTTNTPSRNCTAVARLGLDGALDTAFGHGGLSCLTSAPYLRLAVQSTGQPLLSNDSATIRLLLDDHASPGLIGVTPDTFVDESAGTATLTISRSGGKDGAVSVDYNTVAGTATAGSDYTAASGRLEWADGEDGDRTITIAINNDTDSEGSSLPGTQAEEFSVEFSAVTEAPMLVSAARVVIMDNDASAPQSASSNGDGGGGSTSWLSLLVLLGFAGWRRILR